MSLEEHVEIIVIYYFLQTVLQKKKKPAAIIMALPPHQSLQSFNFHLGTDQAH